ncbi:HNH endonuclease domain protein [Slackia sp. CM382]|uniref:HNH endonuclease n=1 Tax=Slackia sp. CM382 TaxID=1111137 RepID=UPI00027C6BC9|nr:HNH endonuclease signature motif containing protein [Slackia sp. CM382]EJU31959.1 HNH endonuclease domain protein [Slackia sp. CM382]
MKVFLKGLGVVLLIGLAFYAPPVVVIVLAVFAAFKIYEIVYYRGEKFQSIKARIAGHIQECNDMNAYIEGLKAVQLGTNQVRYGTSDYRDNSRWNYKRSKLKSIRSEPNVHSCSRSVCDNSRRDPIKYVCKYFGFKADEATLDTFEGMLNDFEAVEEGKRLLVDQKNEIMASIDGEVPWLIKKLSAKRLSKELGFEEVDLSEAYYPSFVFQYVSSGGNASMENEVVMNVPNLNAMVNYLNDRIKWKKSVAGQRALMTSALRRYILDRGGHRCKRCGIGTAEEPHLLLEVDHIVPVSKGGMTKEDNLQTLCWKCNRSKGAKIA